MKVSDVFELRLCPKYIDADVDGPIADAAVSLSFKRNVPKCRNYVIAKAVIDRYNFDQ